MAPRWLPGRRSSCAAVLLATMLAAPAAAFPARAGSGPVTVKAPTVLRMAGSDIFCTVNTQTGIPAVACFHDPGGASSSVRKGYAIVAFDRGVAIEPPGTTTPNKTATNPAFTSALITGGSSHKTLVTLALKQGAFVSGSHMAVAVETAKEGGNAIGVIYIDAKGSPIVGSYSVGISNHYVTIVKVTGPTVAKTVYRHAVY